MILGWLVQVSELFCVEVMPKKKKKASGRRFKSGRKSASKEAEPDSGVDGEPGEASSSSSEHAEKKQRLGGVAQSWWEGTTVEEVEKFHRTVDPSAQGHTMSHEEECLVLAHFFQTCLDAMEAEESPSKRLRIVTLLTKEGTSFRKWWRTLQEVLERFLEVRRACYFMFLHPLTI